MSISDLLTGGDLSPANLIFGAGASADAARDAAELQAAATREGVAETRRQFDLTRETLQPSIEAGDRARQQQQDLLGLSGGDAQQTAVNTILESPAQKFIRKRAQRNLLQNSAAIGGTGGGNVRSALVEQGAGFAAQDIENQFGRLQDLSAPGTRTAVNQGQFGQQAAQQIAGLTRQGAQASASGILGAQAAQQAGVSQTVGLAGQVIGAVAKAALL